MIIGFDMDGVIIDHTEPRLRLAAVAGFKLTPAETNSALLRQHIPEELLRKIQHQIYDDPKLATRAPMMNGAMDGLEKVVASGVRFYLISRRQNTAVAIKLLKNHDLWPKVFNEANAFFVFDPIDKEIKAKELGVTHYVDDEVRILDVLASVPNKYLFDQHDALADRPDFSRIRSWEELLTKLPI